MAKIKIFASDYLATGQKLDTHKVYSMGIKTTRAPRGTDRSPEYNMSTSVKS